MADNRPVTATLGRDRYRTRIETPAHTVFADEPADVGGTDTAPTPGDYMRMSLASCTAITLRMYADRKQWDVEEIKVTVTSEQQAYKYVFKCQVEVTGNIDDAQRARLLQIADACPVHKVFANPIVIETVLT